MCQDDEGASQAVDVGHQVCRSANQCIVGGVGDAVRVVRAVGAGEVDEAVVGKVDENRVEEGGRVADVGHGVGGVCKGQPTLEVLQVPALLVGG